MAKKSIFLTQKEAAKTMQEKLYNTVAAAGSGIVSSLILNGIRNKFANPTAQEIFGHFGGVVLLAAGSSTHIFARNPMLSATGLGVATMGAAQTIIDIKPDLGAKMAISLNGLGNIDSDFDNSWIEEDDDYQLGEINEQAFDIISQIAEKIDKGDDPNQIQLQGDLTHDSEPIHEEVDPSQML